MIDSFAPREESKDASWPLDRMLLLIESVLPNLQITRNKVKEFRNGPIREVELLCSHPGAKQEKSWSLTIAAILGAGVGLIAAAGAGVGIGTVAGKAVATTAGTIPFAQ